AVYFGVEASRGLLTPGTYAYLNVDGTAFTNVRFRVPTGWTWDGRSLSKGGGGTPHGAAIFFFDAVVQVYADPCHWAAGPAHPPTGSTAAALMAALAAQPSRRATVGDLLVHCRGQALPSDDPCSRRRLSRLTREASMTVVRHSSTLSER